MRTCFGLLLLTLVAVRASLITFQSRDECIVGCARMWADYIQMCLSRRIGAPCINLNENGRGVCSNYCERYFPTTPHR
ncbi:unnamed protein product [Dicrocoelium dendriticum]|nr:unnamed protein product [Dicrocoelium dendriticum]